MFDQKFRKHWRSYVLQSGLAALTVLVLILVLTTQEAVLVASIGASAFIVFAMPNSIAARVRNVLGGQFFGLICGGLCYLLPHSGSFSLALVCALAVGLSMLVMVSTNTEHPPAAGTALALALEGATLEVLVTVMASAAILSLARLIAGKKLRDLV